MIIVESVKKTVKFTTQNKNQIYHLATKPCMIAL